MARISPDSTAWPGSTVISLISPGPVALISFSIFIALDDENALLGFDRVADRDQNLDHLAGHRSPDLLAASSGGSSARGGPPSLHLRSQRDLTARAIE